MPTKELILAVCQLKSEESTFQRSGTKQRKYFNIQCIVFSVTQLGFHHDLANIGSISLSQVFCGSLSGGLTWIHTVLLVQPCSICLKSSAETPYVLNTSCDWFVDCCRMMVNLLIQHTVCVDYRLAFNAMRWVGKQRGRWVQRNIVNPIGRKVRLRGDCP